MKYQLDHDLHIHSVISNCSGDSEQTAENILRYAKAHGLKQICLTDHFWDESVPGASRWYREYHKFTDLIRALPLPQDEGVEFLFGCETDMDKNGVIGISPERYGNFDFIIVPTTHLHMRGFTIDEADIGNADRLARLWVQRFDTLLTAELPFGKVGLAHPCTACIAPENKLYLEVLKRIPESDIGRLFEKAAALGIGIELNGSDCAFDEADAITVMRPLYIAKECGCKFYYGSDAHKGREFAVISHFDRVAELLGLTEDDKFVIKR